MLAFRSHKYISSLFRPRNIRLSDPPSPPGDISVLASDFPAPVFCFFADSELPLGLLDRAADDARDEVIGVPILQTNGPRLFMCEDGGANCGSMYRA